MNNILFEASPIDTITGNAVTVRLSTAFSQDSSVLVDGKRWEPCIIDGPVFKYGVFADGKPTDFSADYGAISFVLDDDFANIPWTALAWDGCFASVWVGELGADFSSYRRIFSGQCGAIVRDARGSAKVSLNGAETQITGNLLSQAYAGTGGIEGPAELTGTLKPVTFGFAENVEAVLIDRIYWVYQVHGGAIQNITAQYANAIDQGASVADYSSYAALSAATLAPGTWATCNAQGLFRLASEPSNKITVDVRGAMDGSTYAGTVGTIVTALLRGAGLIDASIDLPALAGLTDGWSYHVKEQVSVGDVVRKAVFEAGCYIFPDSTGKFRVGKFQSTKTPTILYGDRSGDPSVRPDTIEQISAASPAYRVKIGYRPCWSTHSATDISPAILDAEDAIDALTDRAVALDAAVTDAARNAAYAKQRVDTISNDSVLDRSEKLEIVAKFQSYSAERAGLISTATGLGITTEATVYTTAYNALSSYLTGLTPAFSDTAIDTPIVRADFDGRFSDYLAARQTLLSRSAAVAATLAKWDGVTGSNKPADNATVGAPVGTSVGGRPVETVLADTDNAKGNAQAAVDALKDNAGQLISINDLLGRVTNQETVYGDKLSSKNNADAAAASQAVAQTAASNASTAFDGAKTARDAAQAAQALALTNSNTATQAKSDAQAASSAAQTALTNSNTAKAAAETARTNAQTAQTASEAAKTLSQSAQTAAQTAATNAGTSATNANTSAVNSASTYTNTTRTAAQLFPSDFSRLGQFWARSNDGAAPTTIVADAANSFPTDAVYGTVYQMTGNGSAYGGRVGPLGYFQPVAGRRYRAEAIVKIVSLNTTTGVNVVVSQRGLTSAYAYAQDFGGGTRNSTNVVGSWVTIYQEFDGTALLALNSAIVYSRPYISIAGNTTGGATASFDGVMQVASFQFKDITEVYNSQAAATAAAGSASTATTKADAAGVSATSATGSANTATTKAQNAADSATAASTSASAASGSATTAGQQASAAQTSAQTATTKAGEASTSASSSAGSASDALSSKNAASASATLAANSATAAGGSATAANTSAGTASTQATNAGNSATAAQTANIAATSAAMGASYLDVAYAWDFTASQLNNFGVGGATLAASATGALITNNSTDPIFVTPPGVAFSGARYTRVVVDFVRVTARTGGNWEAGLYWNNASHGESATYLVNALNRSLTDVAVGERSQLIFDINSATPTAQADWLGSTITRLRFDFDNGASGSSAVRILSIRVVGADGMAPAKSATAAAGSASTAVTKATEAGQSASAAKTSETNASTSAGNASTYANNASTSASNALGSANSATSQAGVASSAQAAAVLTATNLHPTTFEQGISFFGGDGGSLTPGALLESLSGVNIFRNTNSNSYDVLTWKTCVANKPSNRWKVRARVGNVQGIASSVEIRLAGYGIQAPVPGSRSSYQGAARATPADGFIWVEAIFDAPDVTTNPFVRPEIVINYGPGAANTFVRVMALELVDVTSELNAGASATAAAGSASTASTKADAAGQSASSALGSASSATTKAGEALTSAGQASTSASNAAGSAVSAASSATVSAKAAGDGAANSANDNRSPGSAMSLWSYNEYNTLAPSTRLTGDTSIFSSVNGQLRVGAVVAHIHPVAAIRVQDGKRYRAYARIKLTGDNSQPGGHNLYVTYWDAAGNLLAGNTVQVGSTPNFTVADGFREISRDISTNGVGGSAQMAAGTAFMRVMYRSSGAPTEVALLYLEDVEAQRAAQDSAAASAVSASTASASKDAAGQSASAANTSATNAGTSAGQASTSASNASTSASNALGSANTATTQAGLAAGSASGAAGSANAANTSASTAGTAATNAGNSASAANTSNLSAIATALNMHPTTFEQKELFFGGDGGSTVPIGTFESVSGVWTIRNNDSANYGTVSWKSCVANKVGKWKVRAKVGNISGIASAVQLRLSSYATQAPTGNRISYVAADRATPANGFIWVEATFDGADVINNPWVKPEMVINYGAGSAATLVRVMAIELVDVTGETNAGASATLAAGSASTASVKADAASGSASTALTQANNAAAYRDQANTSASNASTSANNASASAASASTSATISSSYSNAAFNINDKFANWPDATTYPVGYSTWTNGGNWRFERQPGFGSAYCIRTLNDVAGVNSGFQQSFTCHNGVWIIEATVMLDGGTWSGAGMSVSGVFNYHFATEADTNGVVSSNTGVGSVRTWSKMFTINGNISAAATLYGMHGWQDGYGGVDPKYLRWYSLRVRPATSGEISGGAALTLSNTNSSNISTLSSTVATNQQALATRATTLEARAFAGGNLLGNTTFPNANTAGWSTSNYGGGTFGFAVNFAGDAWHPVGENVLGVYQSNRAGGDTKGRWHSERMTITGGAYYCAYVQSASHRALNEVILEWFRTDGSSAGISYSGPQWTGGGGNTAAGFSPLGFKSVQSPSDAVQLVVTLVKGDTVAGQADSYAWFWHPYVGLARPTQDEYNPYAPGSGSVVLNAIAARVTTTESVVADINGKLKASLTQEVSAGTGRAIVSLRADGQTGSSNIDFAASNFRMLTPGAGDGYVTALSVDGNEAVFSGKLRVGVNKSGKRTEITEAGVRVFDATGSIRVQLGDF